jgi:hypothetical protein
MKSTIWITIGFISIAVVSVVLTALYMKGPLQGPMGDYQDVQNLVAEKSGYTILLCRIESTSDSRRLKVAACIRPSKISEEGNWSTVSLPQLGENAQECQGAIVFIDPKDKSTDLVMYIYDGKVSLLRQGKGKVVTVSEFIAGVSK